MYSINFYLIAFVLAFVDSDIITVNAFGIANRRHSFALLSRKSFGNSHLSATSHLHSGLTFLEPIELFDPFRIQRLTKLIQIFALKLNLYV